MPTLEFNLVKNISIGENVCYKENSMFNAFRGCANFNSPITIPNGVTNIAHTFYGCSNFNQPITIPNGVTNISRMFSSCNNFNQPITIPASVANLAYAFYSCSKFNQPITIPNSVTDLSYTFHNCPNLSGNIYIYSNNVQNICNFIASRNNSRQINIFAYYGSETYNRFLHGNYYSTSSTGIRYNNCFILGTNGITWTSSGTQWFNTKYNVYLLRL